MSSAPRTSDWNEPVLSADMLARFRAGDPDAFAEVVRSCTPLVRAIAGRFWRGSVFEQEEAMQEVWVHVYAKREVFDLQQANRFRGWVAVLARNRCIQIVRAAGRAAMEIADDELERIADETAPSAATETEGSELRRAVEAFKAKLEPQWQRFFELHFVQGRDYAEISRQLGITKIRCKYMKKKLASRARRSVALREALGRAKEKP